MKRIKITEKQRRTINEALEVDYTVPHLPSHILSAIRNNETPLSDNPVLPNGYAEKIAAQRFLEVKKEFSDDITSYDNKVVISKLSKLIAKCVEKEKNLHSQLEKLCLNSIMELFNIPEDGVEITCHLQEEISQRTQFHITPDTDENVEYEDYESMETEETDVKKRKVINTLIVGGATKLAQSALKSCLSKLFDLDEELPHLYSQIMKINDYLIFSHKFEITDKSHKQGGFVTVKLGNDATPTKIEATAIVFPILLMEVIRGCMELWASQGLPDDAEKAKAVINRADALENDPWYTRFGPVLWDKLSSGLEEETKYLPSFFSALAELPTEEFNNVLREVFVGTKLGKTKVAQIMQQAKRDDDYSSFEYDIRQKQSDKGIIADGYFTEEELDEAIYPDTFNMEEFKQMPSFRQRIEYCQRNLQRLSSGSARIVYKIDNGTVLKLAKNQKGIAQNEVEGQPDYYRDSIGLFAEVYDRDENYLWIEMQLARKAKPSDFQRLAGVDYDTVCKWIDYCDPRHKYRPYKDIFETERFQNDFDEYGLLAKLQDYIGNYNVPIGDLRRLSSWGVVIDKDGEEDLVIIDYGLDDYVFNNFYNRA